MKMCQQEEKTVCYSINLFYFIAFFAQREKRNIVVHNLYMNSHRRIKKIKHSHTTNLETH